MRLVSRQASAFAAAILLAPLWAPPAAAVEERIGDVEMVRVWAYGTPVEQARGDLLVEQAVFGDEVVETVRDGALHLRFVDDTQFRLGSNSRAVIDSFVYDADKGTGEIALSLSKGLFRYISGNLKGESITIRTPTATIGLRGTVVTIYVAPDGATFVSASEGEAWLTSLDDRSIVVVRPGGDNGMVAPEGSAATHTGEVGASDSGIEPGAGFEAQSSVDTGNTGEGEGGSASAGQTPAGNTTAALFGGEGGDVLEDELISEVLATAGLLLFPITVVPLASDTCAECTTAAANTVVVEEPAPPPVVADEPIFLLKDISEGFSASFSEFIPQTSQ
jgi:hypothetical protein